MYLPLNPDYLNTRLKKAIKKASKFKFDSIAYTGHSGALVAIPMALSLKKHIVIVRKPHEKSHGTIIEKNNIAKNCLIVDDFIETGKTLKRIKKHLDNNEIKPVGIILYDSVTEREEFEGIKLVRC